MYRVSIQPQQNSTEKMCLKLLSLSTTNSVSGLMFLILPNCLGYFLFAERKKHDQNNLQKEAFNWSLLTVSNDVSMPIVEGSMARDRHAAGAVSENLHLICK